MGAAQAAEITNDDTMAAGKIDLIIGLLLGTFDRVTNSAQLVPFLDARGEEPLVNCFGYRVSQCLAIHGFREHGRSGNHVVNAF
jgi:hypothetical protein